MNSKYVSFIVHQMPWPVLYPVCLFVRTSSLYVQYCFDPFFTGFDSALVHLANMESQKTQQKPKPIEQIPKVNSPSRSIHRGHLTKDLVKSKPLHTKNVKKRLIC